ncbi:MAG: regulatory protein RecX [Polyangiaceae bacterium]
MTTARRTARQKPSSPPAAIDEAALSKAALGYLNRRDASRSKLRQHLERWVTRSAPEQLAALRPLIDQLLTRYQASGLIDDQRLAENAVKSLRARGKSARAISHKLSAQGVGGSSIDAALSADRRENAEAELSAARALARKRKLGAYRPESERAERRQKDLAVLARAGFDFDICRRALGGDAADDEF